MLTNPSYKGITYAGTHTPIVPIEVWYRVQTVLSAHNSAGDRRRHDHYLKGTVYYGACGSRLMISNARSALIHHVEGSSKTRGVEPRRFELLTSCMQGRRSAN